jgi:hypothetical protein
MFDRLQKPFLTVETGEAYQPIRLTYTLTDKAETLRALEKLHCVEKSSSSSAWTWYWRNECDSLHFESLTAFRKPQRAMRLGTFTIQEDKLYLNLPSFKRACLALTFFHRIFTREMGSIQYGDFINKVFSLDERLPHGFTELFKEEELNLILEQRVNDYYKVKARCEDAATAEEAFAVLAEYTHTEATKRLPYAERYVFDFAATEDADVMFLAFYIFLRGRELVAIKRWFGQLGYNLADAAEDTFDQVFGDLGIDLLE